ncbi:MAG: SDR family oxidoreductase [Pirellulales bacterium]|nr:SDR family oxidoreductase [Pirellulales bacterium]
MSPQKVALITGAGKERVGWHVAAALGERGYRLAIHYNSSAAEAEQTVADFTARGWTARAFAADLTQEDATRQMTADVLAHYGRIDALVTCAAIWQRKRLEDVTANDVLTHFKVNTLGTFLCAQHVGLAMVGQESGGAIVTIGDWAEVRPYLDYAAYFPSKGGVTALTRALAVELAARNPRVRVNGILPGPVMLPPDLPPEEREEAIAGTLVRSEGNPRHIALAVLHFLENDFITGVCLPVDGGRTIAG